MNKITDFPQYRKLINELRFYRILNDREFDEIQIMGNQTKLYTIKAVQYPEILRIQDMLNCEEAFVMSDEVEFNSMLK